MLHLRALDQQSQIALVVEEAGSMRGAARGSRAGQPDVAAAVRPQHFDVARDSRGRGAACGVVVDDADDEDQLQVGHRNVGRASARTRPTRRRCW